MTPSHSEPHDRAVCLRLAERLSEYLDGELPPELSREVETHFEGCATCERFLDSLRRTRDAARYLPEALSGEDLERLKREARRRLDT
jgi:anti-sigma factor RsiW